MELLTAKASIQIQKPIHEVFEAIINPKKMSKYFISESTGVLEENKEVEWKFPEFDQRFTIKKVKLILNKEISFVWDEGTMVSIYLEPFLEHDTIVKIEETGKLVNTENINWAIRNTEGWANFLASLKAFLEYKIELRKGAFDFMK